jgi:hypothetical protein
MKLRWVMTNTTHGEGEDVMEVVWKGVGNMGRRERKRDSPSWL